MIPTTKRFVRRDNQKPAGIKEIAESLGVSIGTVDRALHNRPKITPQTRERVLEMARRLGYRPNIAARHLKLNRKLIIAVHLPREIASFSDDIRDGIREAAAPLSSSIEVQFRNYPRLGVGDIALFDKALREKVNGIILVPSDPDRLRPWIAKAAKNRVPVVCVATDAPGTERLSSISEDSYTGGALAAELLTRCCREQGPILVVTGDLNIHDHAEKLRGFNETLVRMQNTAHPVLTIEAHDDPGRAYHKVNTLLKKQRNICAVYVSTSNSVPVIRALEDGGRIGQVRVVASDLFPALVRLMRSDKVLATVYQRPRAQGRMAFQFLYQFLVEGTQPVSSYKLPPYVILQSNLHASSHLLPDDFEHSMKLLHPPRKEAW
jgi:LacI family transcriptional regulator